MALPLDYVKLTYRALCEVDLIILVTYVDAWVIEAGRDDRHLETQINVLTGYGVRDDLIYQDAGAAAP